MTAREQTAPETLDVLRLENQLCFGLYAATHALTRAYRPLLAELGVTYSQFLVLLALWERDGQTVSALGAHLFLDSGTLSPVLKRLEAAGFVRKRRQSRDERVVEVMLTEQGNALRPRVRDVCMTVRARLGLSETEITDIRQELNAIIETLRGDEAVEPDFAEA